MESYIQVPPDSTGKKMRTRQRTVGANTVEEQYLAQGADPTYYIYTGTVTSALGKTLLAVVNTSASQVVRLRKMFLISGQMTAVTGVAQSMEFNRISSVTGGTAVVATASDVNDGALSNVVISVSPSSVQSWGTLFHWFTNSDEVGATNAFPTSYIQSLGNMLPEGNEVKELNCRQNQGFSLRISSPNSTVGTWAILAVISVEAI